LIGAPSGAKTGAMPTNILRQRGAAISAANAASGARPGPDAPRRVLIRAGRVSIRAELLDTPTAERIWAALPIYSTAETWGGAVHFETPVESGRERGRRLSPAPARSPSGARRTG